MSVMIGSNWKLDVDANGNLIHLHLEGGEWVPKVTVTPDRGGEIRTENMVLGWFDELTPQLGLTIVGPEKGVLNSGGLGYMRIFSRNPHTGVLQMNLGIHTDPDPEKRMAFMECIEQGVSPRPVVIQPQYQAPLVPTLLNGWQNYGSPCTTANYFKDSFGRVHVGGRVKNGSGVIMTLPAGFRPVAEIKFLAAENNGVSVVKVEANGNVSQVTGGNTELALDNITFPTS